MNIQTPCPACGNRSLTVDEYGELVCLYLECKDPTLILRLVDEVSRYRTTLAAVSQSLHELQKG